MKGCGALLLDGALLLNARRRREHGGVVLARGRRTSALHVDLNGLFVGLTTRLFIIIFFCAIRSVIYSVSRSIFLCVALRLHTAKDVFESHAICPRSKVSSIVHPVAHAAYHA